MLSKLRTLNANKTTLPYNKFYESTLYRKWYETFLKSLKRPKNYIKDIFVCKYKNWKILRTEITQHNYVLHKTLNKL